MDPERVQELLAANAADDETQEARRQACKGKRLLWFTSFYTAPGYRFGVKDMLDHIARLGIRFWVVLDPSLEADRKMAEMMGEDGLLEDNGYLFIDITDPTKTVDRVLETIREKNLEFDASFGTSEHIQQLASIVAQRLGLAGNPPDSYSIARDKRLARDACREHNVATPKYDYLYGSDDIDRICEAVGFPCVIKPSSGCASQGVTRCDNAEGLRREHEKISSEMSGNRMYTWNPGLDAEHLPKVLVEQYIDGEEFDVDVLMWDGEVVYSNVLDNWPCIEPYFQEVAAHCPSVHPDKVESLKAYAAATVKAMGFTQGAYHVECKYSEVHDQPYLIEVNPRMGGGGTGMFHKDVYGVDLFEGFVMTALGIPVNPPRSPVPLCGRVYYDVNALQTGVLAHTRWLDHLQTHPNVTYVLYRKKAGDTIQGLDTGMPDWVANIHVKAPTIEEALELMRGFEQTIACPMLAPDGKVFDVPSVPVQAKSEAAGPTEPATA